MLCVFWCAIPILKATAAFTWACTNKVIFSGLGGISLENSHSCLPAFSTTLFSFGDDDDGNKPAWLLTKLLKHCAFTTVLMSRHMSAKIYRKKAVRHFIICVRPLPPEKRMKLSSGNNKWYDLLWKMYKLLGSCKKQWRAPWKNVNEQVTSLAWMVRHYVNKQKSAITYMLSLLCLALTDDEKWACQLFIPVMVSEFQLHTTVKLICVIYKNHFG